MQRLLCSDKSALKWEGQVKCSGRKDKIIIIMILGRFYSTFVTVVLIADTLLMKGNVSEFSACAPGDGFGSGRGKFKRCLHVCRGTQAPKLLVAAMVTTFRIT